MQTTKIEYLTHHWGIVSGCKHGPDVCAISAACWARAMATQYKRDFTPQVHADKLQQPFPRTHGAIIGVCFTGDLFGDWVFEGVIWAIRRRVVEHPEHTFMLLTKNPARYADFGPWPVNAWLGTTITGAETLDVQRARYIALLNGADNLRMWLSYEPVMGPLMVPLGGIQWLVVGGFSRGKPTREMVSWAEAAIAEADRLGIPVWVKQNLGDALPKRQERPL